MVRAQKRRKPSTDVIEVDVGAAKMEKGRRKWEDLDADCLANVFSRLGMESLVLGIPFVCKSWYATSLDSCLWQFLYFPEFEPYPIFTESDDSSEIVPETYGAFYDKFVQLYGIHSTRFSITGFVKLIVNRSKGKALELKLPQYCTQEAYRYVADACPRLRVLSFPDDLVFFQHSQVIAQLIGKWKYLEHLTVGGNMSNILRQSAVMSGKIFKISKHFYGDQSCSVLHTLVFNEILVQIGINCKNIRTLHVFDIEVDEADAMAIVTLLPNLQELVLRNCCIRQDSLVALLQGCKKLFCFHVLDCSGFKESKEEVRKLASHIINFRCEAPKDDNVLFKLARKSLLLMIALIRIKSLTEKLADRTGLLKNCFIQ